ncbi:MAG: phage portal protein [Marivivens sp.]|nr:phage portal protein [Marivivens sp.]
MWPFNRNKRKQRRNYAGAATSRLTSDWVSQGTSADSEVKNSLRILRNRARSLVRDSDFAKSALRAVKNNVVGQGIKHQAQVRMVRGGRLDERLNSLIEYEWKKWGKAKNCHAGGTLSWSDIQRLCLNSMIESGEVFVRFVYQEFGDSKVPFGLEILEADFLDDDYTGLESNGNRVRMGVEINEWGRPVAYHFLTYHPGDYQFSYGNIAQKRRIRVPAEEIIHLYAAERPGQTRGVTAFASAIMRLNNLKGYEEAEIIAARASSAMMGFVRTPDQELFEDGTYDDQSVLDFAPGSIRRLAPGEEMQFFSPSRPDDAFTPFVAQMLRAVAAGVGCSYTQVSSDFSQSNYSSSRLELLETRAHYRTLQQYMIETLCQRVYEKWMDMAVMSGALRLPGFDIDPDRYYESKWIAPAAQFVDPQKEAEAYKSLVRSGIMTLSQVISLHGGDFEEVMRQRQHELAMLDELGIVTDTDPSAVTKAGQAQNPPIEDTEHPEIHES